MKYLAFSSYLCFFLVQQALGHGAMYYPSPWWATSECSPDLNPESCEFNLKLPPTGCTGYCSKQTGLVAFFTNYTVVEKRTLPKKYLDNSARTQTAVGLHPWNSPGSAPTFGNGCGANGGNPNGCIGEPDNVYGRCCGGNGKAGDKFVRGCGGYVGGKSALSHYKDGFFGTPSVTTWERGTNQEVLWASSAYHRGGYAYRLCKVKNGKIWKVTENCFQNGHLKFAGDETWIYYFARPWGASEDEPFNPDNFVAQPIVKTTIGTTPEGSEWAKVNLPSELVGKNHWAFKDLVEVPEDLEPGEYVLSFRWDCQESPQVWNSCANIQIV